MESAQGYGPWLVGVRIFSGVPYAEMAESGLWRLPRKQEVERSVGSNPTLRATLVSYIQVRKAVRINRRALNPSQ